MSCYVLLPYLIWQTNFQDLEKVSLRLKFQLFLAFISPISPRLKSVVTQCQTCPAICVRQLSFVVKFACAETCPPSSSCMLLLGPLSHTGQAASSSLAITNFNSWAPSQSRGALGRAGSVYAQLNPIDEKGNTTCHTSLQIGKGTRSNFGLEVLHIEGILQASGVKSRSICVRWNCRDSMFASVAFTATSGDVHTGNVSAVVVHRRPAPDLQGYCEVKDNHSLHPWLSMCVARRFWRRCTPCLVWRTNCRVWSARRLSLDKQFTWWAPSTT